MNSEQINLKYIQCQRGGDHQSQQVNIVCLNPECLFNPLCCAVCVQEQHSTHQTIPLKKLVLQAKQKIKQIQKPQKQEVKNIRPFMDIDIDILKNILSTSKKENLQKFKQQKQKIQKNIKEIQQGYQTYYYKMDLKTNFLLSEVKEKSKNIENTAQRIQKAQQLSHLLPSIQKGIIILESVENSKDKQKDESITFDIQPKSVQNYNQKIQDLAVTKLIQTTQKLSKERKTLQKEIVKMDKIFDTSDLFKFSDQLKPQDVWVTESSKAVSKKQGVYQAILMQPQIKQSQEIIKFRFKMPKTMSSWVAVGVGYQNILKQNKFIFSQNTGHGCYLVSSNNGSWSHHDTNCNNLRLSFRFEQQDIVTVIVNQKEKLILFRKQISAKTPYQQFSNTYELNYKKIPQDKLHPCVVFYFSGDQVEYLPAIKNQISLNYQYQFMQKQFHPNLQRVNSYKIKNHSLINAYSSAILGPSLQSYQKVKKFSFKINRSLYDWVAVGICHAKTAAKNSYILKYDSNFHGFYLISANGGSWSSIDPSKNNKLLAFKFKSGDIIQCQVRFSSNNSNTQNKIIFKKQNQIYSLAFKLIKGDPVHPCIVLYHQGDQVSIMPEY